MKQLIYASFVLIEIWNSWMTCGTLVMKTKSNATFKPMLRPKCQRHLAFSKDTLFYHVRYLRKKGLIGSPNSTSLEIFCR